MSRITFGYHLNKLKKINDLFGEEALQMKVFLNDVKNKNNVSLQAWFSAHYTTPSLKIKIEGDLPIIKNTLEDIISKKGLPGFVDIPRKEYRSFSKIITGKEAKDIENTPTTSDAYEMMKKKYSEQKINVALLDNGTLAIDIGYI
jgi:hypothetical protein